jgi:glucose/arabinose dehydrogenase
MLTHFMRWVRRFFPPTASIPLPQRRTRPQLEPLEDRTVPALTLPVGFKASVFASGLSQPTSMAFAPDGRLFVTEKDGELRVIQNGQLLPTPFLQVNVNTFSERGLESVAFDPNFASNHFLYVYYTTNASTPVNRVSRFQESATNPNVVQPGSETVLLDNIPSINGNHNGGALHFGTDGKLYVGVGDSGVDPTSPANNAQNLGSLSGKILRINSDGSIPSDNPFAGVAGDRGEIWAYGFRNPFTFNVSASTGKIFVNDVGQNTWEEIDDLQKGGDYGWPAAEGPSNPTNNPHFIAPISFYNHNGQSAAITGGVFYEASQFPPSRRGYFFSDFINGFIRQLNPVTHKVTSFASGADSPVDLDVAPDGSLMFLSINSGEVFRIRFTGTPAGRTVIVSGSPAGQLPFVRGFDAATGQLRFKFLAFPASFRGGVRVAAGDVNGDGKFDIIVVPASDAPPIVKVIDGRTGRLLERFLAFRPGYQDGLLVALADVNHDHKLDVIVARSHPRVIRYFNPLTGALEGFLKSYRFPGLSVVAHN